MAIARALINDPEVLVADEPTANLDSELTKQFLEIVEALTSEGKTVLMTSHDPRIWQSPVVRHRHYAAGRPGGGGVNLSSADPGVDTRLAALGVSRDLGQHVRG